jgi:hypothetical protein
MTDKNRAANEMSKRMRRFVSAFDAETSDQNDMIREKPDANGFCGAWAKTLLR